jgi:hypothetical protein
VIEPVPESHYVTVYIFEKLNTKGEPFPYLEISISVMKIIWGNTSNNVRLDENFFKFVGLVIDIMEKYI